MADKSISELTSINLVTGDEYLYGIQSSDDVKIVADDLADYILNTYEFSDDITNTGTVGGKIISLQAITNTSDLADRTYPQGSLYWSRNSTSPAELFGGIWTRVKDKFALAAGSTYTAGANGGEVNHLLTLSEMPSHNHNSPTGGPSNNTSAGPSTANTGDTDAAHTHSIPALSGTTTKTGNHTHTVSGRNYDNTTPAAGSALYDVTTGNSAKMNWNSAGAHTHSITVNSGWLNANTATHTHSMNSHTHSLSAHTHSISAQGGGGQHNNMPPYVTYYCWERVE